MPFKFSFPLPGRKASDDTQGSPIFIDTPNDSHDDSPLSDPGSKAERVLGTLEPSSPHGLSNKSSRKALRKKPSFMSATLSEAENNSSAANGFPFPDMPSSRGSSRRPSHNLQNQASSPLLGERFFKGSPGTDSTTNSPSPRPHFYGSSSTLRSYYDPAKSPLSISQQTSASSARDMALRKGYPTISSPLTQDVSNEISPSAMDDERRPATDHGLARKPARFNLSKFSATHKTSTVPNVLSDETPKSPSQASYSSSQQSASSGRPNWWKRKKAKEAKFKKSGGPPDEPNIDQHDLGVDSLKTNIRKPPAGMRHWFDGPADQQTPPTPGSQLDQDQDHGQLWNRRLEAFAPDARNRLPGESEQGNMGELSHHRAPLSNGPEVSETTISRQDSSPGETPNYPDQHKSRSRSSTMAKADLLNHSFLELSSSDDEEVESSIHQSPAYQRHRIRDSIDQNSIDRDVLVSSAEIIRPVKPKPVINTSPRKSKRGSEIIPPVPKIPERPQLQQRVSSMKWRELQNLNSSSITARTTDDSHSSSGGGSIASQASSLRQTVFESHIRKPNPSSKLMSVTSEEGELLEAMRQTRASIRQDAFSESGYTKTFPSPRSNVSRPRTSGPTGRASYLGSDRSVSPPPSLPPANASPQSFRFPDVPSSDSNINRSNTPAPPRRAKPKRAPPIVFPPPKASPTESFSPSDILPSTPRSRLSPLTPSSSAMLDDGDGFDTRGTMRMGHVRKRTVSSGVVVLDGMEERA